jgi:choice-of-anchor B domain-containing protein
MLGIQGIAQNNISFRSNVQYPHILSNLWGYTDSAGREYALVGEETGLAIVDVTNPDQPNSLFFVPNDTSPWQEPKVWQHYAYVVNEHKGGLLIVDLGNLPYSANYVHWSNIPNADYQRAHTCFIDENGFIYINGSNVFERTLICDLKPDPMNPTYVGFYDDYYVHDCFVRNDTMYASEIRQGQFSVSDVHDKTNPRAFIRQETPLAFSHNVWLSDDSRYLFNTDEVKFSTVTCYDISDINNITEVDQYRHSDVDSSIAHNTYYRNGYLYTSYYHDGVTIADAHRPDNIVEVGWFDTSPVPPGNGFSGCWGVYPFFASGNIICSDRQQGLFVLSPQLNRACYLEGTVTNQQGEPLNNVRVDIIGHERYKYSNLQGNYKTGIGDSGTYDVRFTDMNNRCQTLIVGGVELKEGIITPLNVTLACSTTGITNPQKNLNLTATPSAFNTSTTIQLQQPAGGTANIVIYNSTGQQIKEYFINTEQATILTGQDWPAGLYYVVAQGYVASHTLKVVKW